MISGGRWRGQDSGVFANPEIFILDSLSAAIACDSRRRASTYWPLEAQDDGGYCFQS